MKPKSFIIIAGEASGDAIAAELIRAIRQRITETPNSPAPQFFGLGGPLMAAAGAELIFDQAKSAVFGLEAFTRIFEFRRRFNELLKVAIARKPDAIIGVDFGVFNSQFARAIRKHLRAHPDGWKPKIIQYVSPQVWASRPLRARKIARNVDVLLSILPFEKEWYAKRAPTLRVEFVGHPVVDRYATVSRRQIPLDISSQKRQLVILPGSRPSELERHLPVLAEALKIIRARIETRVTMIMPENMIARAQALGLPADVEVRASDLVGALVSADAAIAKSGTITLECAYFGVPTVVLYKTSAATWWVAMRLVTVKWAALPNILANEAVFPEFLQDAATPENIAGTTLEFLENASRRQQVQGKLDQIVKSLGEPGAAQRAADIVLASLNA